MTSMASASRRNSISNYLVIDLTQDEDTGSNNNTHRADTLNASFRSEKHTW